MLPKSKVCCARFDLQLHDGSALSQLDAIFLSHGMAVVFIVGVQLDSKKTQRPIYIYIYIYIVLWFKHNKRYYVPGCSRAIHGNKFHLRVAGMCLRLTFSVARTRVGSPTLLIGPLLRAQAVITNSFLKLPLAVSGRNKSYSSHGSGSIGCSAVGVASAVAL